MQKFDTPLVPISWGELIDKITILEIKQRNIKNENSLANINKELLFLTEIVNRQSGLTALITDLKYQLLSVNRSLWNVEDEIREKEFRKEFDNIFISLARQVYVLNDDRAKLKKAINLLLLSELVEEKSYREFK
jgi:hypothetical protein